VADLDGDPWPDLVFASNDGPLKLYRHRGLGQGKPYAVRLVGPKGNLQGVGARVELVLEGGKKKVAWVHAGGGYLSQDDGVLRFGLGSGEVALQVRVVWPDGHVSELPAPPDGARVTRG